MCRVKRGLLGLCEGRSRNWNGGRRGSGWAHGAWFDRDAADAGFRMRRAARRKKDGIVGDLLCQFGETGFRDMAFQLIDHNGGGAEQMVTHGAGRLALVTFDLSIPSF